MARHLTQPEVSSGASLVTAVTASLHALKSSLAMCCLHLLAAGSENVKPDDGEESVGVEGPGADSQNTWLRVWITAGVEFWPGSVRRDKLTPLAGLEQK